MLVAFVLLVLFFVNWQQPSSYAGLKLSDSRYTHNADSSQSSCYANFTYVGFPFVSSYGLCSGDKLSSSLAVWLNVASAFLIVGLLGALAIVLMTKPKDEPQL